jgi:hypothetical protein
MEFDWYEIYNLDDFEALGLFLKTVEVFLEDVGLVEVLITKGNFVSITYNDILLPINMNDENPFVFEDHAVLLDQDNNIWLGIKNAD